jgi:hypothetical protein
MFLFAFGFSLFSGILQRWLLSYLLLADSWKDWEAVVREGGIPNRERGGLLSKSRLQKESGKLVLYGFRLGLQKEHVGPLCQFHG